MLVETGGFLNMHSLDGTILFIHLNDMHSRVGHVGNLNLIHSKWPEVIIPDFYMSLVFFFL
jgi:hypothetical protein